MFKHRLRLHPNWEWILEGAFRILVASKMFRVGIIGAGLMGTLHARTLVSLQGVEVVAIACRTLEKAQRLAEEVGAESYSDYRRVLEAPLDAVWLTTPDHLHREMAVATLEAGKHLFLEKALATSLEDGRAILAAAERHPKLKAMVGYLLKKPTRS